MHDDDDEFAPGLLRGLFRRIQDEGDAMEASEAHLQESYDRPYRISQESLAIYWANLKQLDRDMIFRFAAMTDKDFWDQVHSIRNANFWDLWQYAVFNDPWAVAVLNKKLN